MTSEMKCEDHLTETERRCRPRGRLHRYLSFSGWTWRICVSFTTVPPDSYGQWAACKAGKLGESSQEIIGFLWNDGVP